MIDWNEVKVGETEIASPRGLKGVVGGLYKDWVWLHFRDNGLDSYHKNSLLDWTIYDPWEEITEDCQWEKGDAFNFSWMLKYKGEIVCNDDPNFKSHDRRVWKRKE